MTPDMFFGICPHTSRTPKFWHTYVITYGDFMVIVDPCNLTSLHFVDVFAEDAELNAEALNIKSYQPWQKHCRGSAVAKCIFI